MVVDQNEGYKYFINGQLVHTNTTENRVFLNNIINPNNAKIGHTDRLNGNEYNFNGDFKSVEIYNEPLSDAEVISLTLPETNDNSLIFREENKQIYGSNFVNVTNQLDELKDLNEGTIIARFRPKSVSSIMSLFSIGNNTQANGHFHLYINGSGLGSEIRHQSTTSSNTAIFTNYNFKANQVYTVAMVVDQSEGYKLFINGELVYTNTNTNRVFLSNIYQPNNAKIGHTDRSTGNEYTFNGDIDFVEVYGEPLEDNVVASLTNATYAPPILNPMPEDVFVTTPQDIFYPGLYGSRNYRIPALLYTSSGTLLAGIDKRINHGGDSPANIDINMRRSLDNGDTWGDEILINDYPGSASNIDQLLLEDASTKRIFSIVDAFPQGYGYPQATQGSGFKKIDGVPYLVLYPKLAIILIKPFNILLEKMVLYTIQMEHQRTTLLVKNVNFIKTMCM